MAAYYAAYYAADTAGTTNFTDSGAKPVKDTSVMMLGMPLISSRYVTVSAKYTLEAGNGYTSNTGDVQVRWKF
ncbi:hypothetical protein [Pseudomonas sp. CCC2.2]|uniref:hypothetical protein n=1 Tax=Pseudomonas sp. CCC2.2 TaxID=3048605 RepID=UPI002B2235E7|nr:hypothetical protein [Pseudomonas sp. CCC2.2]MEB0147025.1 hypothetical protein [Pseudomonas sp. CCC2.2]